MPGSAEGAQPLTAQGPSSFKIDDTELKELSGLAASRQFPGILWAHNDSGDEPLLRAYDQTGKLRGSWRVNGAAHEDWEDMAISPDGRGGWNLWIGDIGRLPGRGAPCIYRLPEPVPPTVPEAAELTTAAAERITLQWPGETLDSEAMMVDPTTGDLYVVSKESGRAGIHRVRSSALKAGATVQLERIAEVQMPGLMGGTVTGGDISPDGRRAVLCSYTAVAQWDIRSATSGTGITWTAAGRSLPVPWQLQREAICWSADGYSVFSGCEGAGPVIHRTPVP